MTSNWIGPVTVAVDAVTPAAADLAGEYPPGTVAVKRHEGSRTAAYLNRDLDVAPFKAGAHIISTAGTGRCSSGFTGLSAGNGARYMITAWHCVNVSDPRFWTSNASGTGGSFIGTATALDADHDIAYVRVAGSTTPRMWDGPILPKSGQFTKRVIGMRHPQMGMTNICTSGAHSGVRCYGTIIAAGRGNAANQWLWLVRANGGGSMAGGGDSGGPVFQPSGDSVYAMGMISQGQPGTELPSSWCLGDATRCFSQIWFADLYTEAYVTRGIDMTK